MAAKALLLQPARVPLGTDKNGDPVLISRSWYRQLEDIASAQVVAANAAAVAELSANVDALALELSNVGSTDILAPIPARDDGFMVGEITFAPVNYFPAVASVVLPTFVDGETPAGTINGTNVTFTLAHAPSPAASLNLFLNGVRLDSGFTLAGSTITYAAAPSTGDTHVAVYRY